MNLNEMTHAEWLELMGSLVDVVEDWLYFKGFTPKDFPNDDREGDEDEAIVYGSDYDMLAEAFSNVLGCVVKDEDGMN